MKSQEITGFALGHLRFGDPAVCQSKAVRWHHVLSLYSRPRRARLVDYPNRRPCELRLRRTLHDIVEYTRLVETTASMP
eukprot:2567877-Prymnesium_polylepis.1